MGCWPRAIGIRLLARAGLTAARAGCNLHYREKPGEYAAFKR